MKFIHIADVHWGMNPDSDRPWSRERAQAIRDSFAEVIRQAGLSLHLRRSFSPPAAPAGLKRGQLPVLYHSRRAGHDHCGKS